AEEGIRYDLVTGVQTCDLPICVDDRTGSSLDCAPREVERALACLLGPTSHTHDPVLGIDAHGDAFSSKFPRHFTDEIQRLRRFRSAERRAAKAQPVSMSTSRLK